MWYTEVYLHCNTGDGTVVFTCTRTLGMWYSGVYLHLNTRGVVKRSFTAVAAVIHVSWCLMHTLLLFGDSKINHITACT